MSRWILSGSACMVLVFAGIVHGVWTDRWNDGADLADAAQRLEAIPTQIGEWEGRPVDVEKDLLPSLAGTLVRRYVHRTSGKAVTIYLACGRAGPVCVHTPDVCYAGCGFVVDTPTRFEAPNNGGEFWNARFTRTKNNEQTNLRIFWGWKATGDWMINDNPRLAFAGYSILNKMYLIREMASTTEPVADDPCVEFMRDLLPVLRNSLS